ncbi:MAG: helix-turn-helix domain-containing protein, partial [Candidatus Gracilibacteria bacterium]
QEFFIENTYPSKEEILKLYDFLYKGEKEGSGRGKVILKTYYTISSESGIGSDMKVGSALKILEKYGILRKGVSENINTTDFRGKGLTLVQEKRKHSNLLVDWNRQKLLKEEAYFKLEQIKKLLFYPTCRKRFILNYFGDEEDLATLPDNCGACDFCIEKKNLEGEEIEDFVNTSVFALILDVVKKNDAKIGVVMMTKFLRGSKDAKLMEWNMHKRENFGALEDLTSELIQAVIEALISQDYLCKTEGRYPLLGITDTGRVAINRNDFLRDDNTELQHYIKIRLGSSATYKKKKVLKVKTEKVGTYNETSRLLKEGKSLKEISEARDLKTITIESHIVKLYELGDIVLTDIMKYSNFTNLKAIKTVIIDDLDGVSNPLKPIKEILENNGSKKISYFEIKIAIAMMEKKDI